MMLLNIIYTDVRLCVHRMAGPSSQGSLLFSLMSRRNLMKAHEILNNPFLNKGTAFTMEEREKLGLIGLLPPHVQTIEEQAAQTYAQMEKKENDLEKRLFLMQIFNTNRTLFYYLFSKHLAEFNPIVYDPTVSLTIEGYSDLFVDPQYAAYLDINHPENI